MSAQNSNVVALLGGLGNQLFQYAFGLNLEVVTGLDTRFDCRPLERYTLHGGMLQIERYFDVKLPRATSHDIRGARRLWGNPRTLGGLFRASKHLGSIVPIRTDYNLDLRKKFSGGYYFGYWQTPELAGEFRKFLCFKSKLIEEAVQILDKIKIDPISDVVVHVRRGDFLKLTESPHLPLPELTYYAPLMQELTNRGAKKFLVISDDIEAVKKGPLSNFNCTFIDPSFSPSAGHDLCLLALCNTKILSASSFSWWGAALSIGENSCVLAPSPWVKLHSIGDPVLAAHPLSTWHLIETGGVQMGNAEARIPATVCA